jgi:DNA-directed RNA polymerase subunit beta'
MSEQVDPVTGFATKVISEFKSSEYKPSIVIVDEEGQPVQIPGRNVVARYTIPAGAQIDHCSMEMDSFW